MLPKFEIKDKWEEFKNIEIDELIAQVTYNTQQKQSSALSKGDSTFLTAQNFSQKRQKISLESTTTTNPNKSSKKRRLGV